MNIRYIPRTSLGYIPNVEWNEAQAMEAIWGAFPITLNLNKDLGILEGLCKATNGNRFFSEVIALLKNHHQVTFAVLEGPEHPKPDWQLPEDKIEYKLGQVFEQLSFIDLDGSAVRYEPFHEDLTGPDDEQLIDEP